MDRVVIDSSVVIKWFVPEPHSATARRLLDGFQAGTLELLAPDLLNAELGNIVWKKQVLRGELLEADAQLAIDDFRALNLPLTPTADLLDAAFRLAVAHQRTVYDCLDVALSVRETCPFVTADERLVNAVSAAVPSVVWLPNWP
jgi:predicted nucleic acid-binding protein